jgi:hypothetical protein
MISHFFGNEAFENQDQTSQNVAYGMLLRMIIHDPSVGNSLCMQSQKVGVVGHDYAIFDTAKFEVLFILCTQKLGFDRRGDIDSAASQPFGYRRVDVFVKMIFDCFPHRRPRAYFGVSMEFSPATV